MHPVIIPWADALEAFYGTQISERQVPVWEHYLRMENPKKGELVAAIEMAAEASAKPEEWRVTVRDLRKWLIQYRRIKTSEERKEESAATLKAFIAEWKEKIARGVSKDDFLCAVDLLPYRIVAKNEIIREVLG